MTTKEEAVLTIMAAQMAQVSLELLGVKNKTIAMLILKNTAKKLRGIQEFLEKAK